MVSKYLLEWSYNIRLNIMIGWVKRLSKNQIKAQVWVNKLLLNDKCITYECIMSIW